MMKRGEIWLVRFDPSMEAEISKDAQMDDIASAIALCVGAP